MLAARKHGEQTFPLNSTELPLRPGCVRPAIRRGSGADQLRVELGRHAAKSVLPVDRAGAHQFMHP